METLKNIEINFRPQNNTELLTYDDSTYNFQLCNDAKVIHTRNYMRYSVLYYKIGFLLANFAQL